MLKRGPGPPWLSRSPPGSSSSRDMSWLYRAAMASSIWGHTGSEERVSVDTVLCWEGSHYCPIPQTQDPISCLACCSGLRKCPLSRQHSSGGDKSGGRTSASLPRPPIPSDQQLQGHPTHGARSCRNRTMAPQGPLCSNGTMQW